MGCVSKVRQLGRRSELEQFTNWLEADQPVGGTEDLGPAGPPPPTQVCIWMRTPHCKTTKCRDNNRFAQQRACSMRERPASSAYSKQRAWRFGAAAICWGRPVPRTASNRQSAPASLENKEPQGSWRRPPVCGTQPHFPYKRVTLAVHEVGPVPT